MDWRLFAQYVVMLVQLGLAILIFYFSGKVLLTMYTLSPFYNGKLPYVPTKMNSVARAFEMLNIKKGERVLDLGSGDGRFVLYGAKRIDAEFVGVELNMFLYWISVMKSFFTQKTGRVSFLRSSYYDQNLNDYDKLFFFNMPSELIRLRKKLEREVRPGVLAVSVIFPLKSEKFRLLKEEGDKSSKLYLYERVD